MTAARSAAPKPEKPREVPETKATTQSASTLFVMTSEEKRKDTAPSPGYPRNVPPVFFVTSATILAATASIS